ncbi:MAG TPA: hypothetical protein VNO50_01275 [Pyrinomonadaceae bacterium]|nr:hypothetical protein [Pyrinomonadaceae bacterium]
MKTTLLISALMFTFLVNSVSAQTEADIERAYGKPLDVYSVSENIWMTPEYSADGNVCSMRLYPKRINQETNFVCTSCELDFKELKRLLNELVPPKTRGLQNESFGQTATGGPAAWTTYGYEKVSFTFVAPFGPPKYDGTTLRKGQFVFTVPIGPPAPPKSRLPTRDDFSTFGSPRTQIVTIRWNDRKCTPK